MKATHEYNLDDKVYHPCDTAPFIVIGIRKNEVEIEGDWSGGTHNVCQSDWVSPKYIQPYDETKVRYYNSSGQYLNRPINE